LGVNVVSQIKDIKQIGAIPVIRDQQGQLSVVLVTTRGSGRWTIPKGNLMTGIPDHRSAEIEALEEAGLVGTIRETPLGHYQFWKRQDAHWALADVTVFVLNVTAQAESFKEKGQRDVRSFSFEDAAETVYESGLAALILKVRDLFNQDGTPKPSSL
jgi:8-oxo-dGTP pyrophosphatase MutT (NUDIX family)